ncbi:MAG: 3-isopropylmalate dehydratase large subunit [Spirochaetales bacterium]|nr:3-isopropylmalate dehydratase large subunit [Spirochaetales bacterium]
MHAIEKILARNSGMKSVRTGEIINAKVDFAEINDLYLQTVTSFYEMGGKRVWDRTKLAFVFDHYAPCPTIKTAIIHQKMREFARENELTHHFDVNAGVCHQVMPEAGVILPGTIVVATDSHTTTHGAFGALGTGCGATDMACIMLTGELWFRVPEIISISINGKAPKGVYAKDVILTVLGKLKADGAVYKAIDFSGTYIDSLGVAERMTICNMALEIGAKTAYMQPNQQVIDYVNAHSTAEYEIQYTDPDFVYAENYSFDVEKMVPVVSCPHSVDNVRPIGEIEAKKIKVDQAYLGSCTNGRTEDIAIAASILKGKHIAPMTRFIVVPASAAVMKECIEKGYISTLIDAGATINPPGCAACLGTHEGIIGPGETCITATNRNFRGRMGSPEAFLYLGSPATVAASILNGHITDPTPYIE